MVQHCFARPFFKNASQRKAVEAARRQKKSEVMSFQTDACNMIEHVQC